LDVRLAWFSPLPPSASGIAAYSAEILPLIAARGFEIDTYTALNAHEFVWRHRRTPYDLTIYQLGNATCHDYMWAYLFRYPGLVVLHDLQLHQARALHLTKRWQPRLDDYIAEVRANHPGAPADLPYLVLARMADRMYQHWPLTRLVIERSRTTAVHNQWVAEDLRAKHPDATIRWFEMGVAASTGRSGGKSTSIRNVRATLGIPPDAFVIIALGGVTPEKRVPQLLRAVSAISSRHRNVHLLFVGAPASHYDVREDAETSGLADRIHIAGFVADTELPAYLATADLCACLRWPTNRETSASWLRCLAAGRPTIITELAHLGAVPTLDPRGWRLLDTCGNGREPVAVSIDVLDEEHSLQLALERLATDPALRERIGRAGLEWWRAHHQLEAMAAAYEETLHATARAPIPSPSLPPHLTDDGTRQLESIVRAFGGSDRVAALMAGTMRLSP
jgi:glycosyltransferase involved in cell wall biosynthesis